MEGYLMSNNKLINSLAKKYGFDECAVISTEPFYQYKRDLDYKNYGDSFAINYNPKDYADDADKIIVMIKAYQPYDENHFTSDHIYVDSYYVAGNESYFNAKKMTEEIQDLGYTAHFSPRISFRHSAFRAGFGKRGMNGLLVNDKYGSYMHIQCIMTDMPIEITNDVEDIETCRKCDLCVTSCKGAALDGTGRVEMKNCIRHYMPAKRYVPEHIRSKVGSRFIGCTDCRESCPENSRIPNIEPPKDLLEACYIPTLIDKEHKDYKKNLKMLQDYLGTNEVRPQKLLKSVVIVAGNTKDSKYIDGLSKLKETETDKDLLEYIDWAIGEIEGYNAK